MSELIDKARAAYARAQDTITTQKLLDDKLRRALNHMADVEMVLSVPNLQNDALAMYGLSDVPERGGVAGYLANPAQQQGFGLPRMFGVFAPEAMSESPHPEAQGLIRLLLKHQLGDTVQPGDPSSVDTRLFLNYGEPTMHPETVLAHEGRHRAFSKLMDADPSLKLDHTTDELLAREGDVRYSPDRAERAQSRDFIENLQSSMSGSTRRRYNRKRRRQYDELEGRARSSLGSM